MDGGGDMRLLTKILYLGTDGHLDKKQMFIRILVLLTVLSVFFSFVTKITFISDDDGENLRIAVVGPMSGDSQVIGRSLRQGAQLYVDTFNESGGIDGDRISLEVVDDEDSPEAARAAAVKLADNGRVQAAIGHWSAEALEGASPAYGERGLTLITPSSTGGETVSANEWLFSTLFSTRREASFLANYARNVLGHKLTSVIFDTSGYGAAMAEDYEKTYKRFGTAIRYKWSFDHTAADAAAQLQAIVAELKQKKDAGVLFLAVREGEAAKLVTAIRDAKIKNLLIGPNVMAMDAFMSSVVSKIGEDKQPAKYTNGILVSSPLLFDTANETAQNFRNNYLAKFGMPPDWIAAYAYDSAQTAVKGLLASIKANGADADTETLRRGIRDSLAARRTVEDAIEGVTGSTFFDETGQAQKPVLVGVYNGKNIISALTQLQPIKPGGGANFIAELKKGRVLYVNDRFMYKTNVVYTGLQVNEISDINLEENHFTLDFLIWFRYRGKFEPQDMTFTNAVEPIVLAEPTEEKQTNDMIYRMYRVKSKFNFDFTDTFRQYSNHLTGVSFSHNNLNRNNLLYVVDVLGIGLDTGATIDDKIEEARALSPNLGWLVDSAWISQDVSRKGTKGDPAYVGYGSADPEFSKVDLGILIKPAEFNARDFIPSEYFIYIGIFGLLGIIFAIAMDRQEKGRFWTVQSWGLRVVAWPMFLLAAGNIILDLAVQHLSAHYIDNFILAYNMLWWIMPARLLGIAMERFVWLPLEDHTERNIPNVVRVFGSVVIYSFASFGVIAFVYEQQLTSLLASTGLLAMIIGLAIQANISNIFSGIVINMERPFNVGDWIKIAEMDEGRVVDITWRTTRIKTRDGYVISVPNGQVSEAYIHNFDSFDYIRLELPLQLDACHPPEPTAKIMEVGLNAAEDILDEPEREVRFKGIEWCNFAWIATYEIQFWIDNYGAKEGISEGVLEKIYHELRKHGIAPSSVPQSADKGPKHLENLKEAQA